MIRNRVLREKNAKQRLTAFVDPVLITRAKIRGALEGLTISELVERALDEYAPKIERNTDQHLNLKFTNKSAIDSLISNKDISIKTANHTRNQVVPR